MVISSVFLHFSQKTSKIARQSGRKTAEKRSKGRLLPCIFNRKPDFFEFYRSDRQRDAKKDKKKRSGVLQRREKVVSLQSQTNGKRRCREAGSFGSSLKEWNGCSKQLEDFFETQR